MPDRVLAIFASLALILLVRPSLFLRRIPNPLLPDTPWNRVQMRGIGLVFCLFVLLVLSGGAPESKWTEGFHAITLVLRGARVFTVPIPFWFLWHFFFRSFFVKAYIKGNSRAQAWRRGWTRFLYQHVP